ncbi:GST3 [Acrasis kona]|uniref:GST3 n=1 Tax=Acrasis kona TaxID=1008807 RepID=A0AAW2ZKZ9_9EUKA
MKKVAETIIKLHPQAKLQGGFYEIPISMLNAEKGIKLCSCGLSKEMPLCDHSHKGTPFGSVTVLQDGDKLLIQEKNIAAKLEKYNKNLLAKHGVDIENVTASEAEQK